MIRCKHYLIPSVMLTIAGGVSSVAAQATPMKAVADSMTADTAKIDPDAIAALTKMGEYLRTLTAFRVSATVTKEDVVQDGEKVQKLSSVDLLAKRPDRMRVEVVNASQPRTFYYDGKNFTLWAPRLKYYATVAAPPTIHQLIDTLEDRLNIEVPFVDLFKWGTPESDLKEIKVATVVGPAVVNGITCAQYAFRQDGLDWQIWIQEGDYPLPLRLVLTTTTDDARPQHESMYAWNLAPSFNDNAFIFTAAPDAKRITFKEAAAARVAAKKPGEKP